MKKTALVAFILLSILSLGYVGIQFLPEPMSSDLALIGEDKPAVVLAYENYSPTGGEALTRLKRVRPDYDSRVNFIVADIGTPQGRAFANRYRLVDGQAVLLARDGQAVAVTGPSTSDQALRQKLDDELARQQ